LTNYLRCGTLFLATALCALPMCAADCKSFSDTIEHSLKLIAMADTRGIGDNSAPRATLDELRINNNLARIQINLELMKASGCALPKDPIRQSDYMSNALDCSLAELKGNSKAPECDLTKWVRQPKVNTTSPQPSSQPSASPAPTAQPTPPQSPSSSSATASDPVAQIGGRTIKVGDQIDGTLASLLGPPDKSTYKAAQGLTVQEWTRSGRTIRALNGRVIIIE